MCSCVLLPTSSPLGALAPAPAAAGAAGGAGGGLLSPLGAGLPTGLPAGGFTPMGTAFAGTLQHKSQLQQVGAHFLLFIMKVCTI